jgi:hypothetical protein
LEVGPSVDGESVVMIGPQDSASAVISGHGDRSMFGQNIAVDNFGNIKSVATKGAGVGYAGMEATSGVLKFYSATSATSAWSNITPSPRMVIDTAGKVGIGTTSPAAILDISGGDIIQRGNGYQFKIKASGGADRVALSNNGGVNGELRLYNNSDVQTVEVSGNGISYFNGGNVGIGTTNPTSALHVIGDIQFTGAVIDVSDRRLKENIHELSGGLDVIRQIPTYSFTMKDDPKKQVEFGVMAQDMMNILPDIVRIINPQTGYMGVSYISLIPWSIRAIQDIDRDVASLKSRVTSLEEANRRLEEKNKEIEAKLDAVLKQLQK